MTNERLDLPHRRRQRRRRVWGGGMRWVGRMDRPKEPEVFVRAVALLARRQDIRGVLLGDGPLLDAVLTLARAESAPVEFMGEQEDVESFLGFCEGGLSVQCIRGHPIRCPRGHVGGPAATFVTASEPSLIRRQLGIVRRERSAGRTCHGRSQPTPYRAAARARRGDTD